MSEQTIEKLKKMRLPIMAEEYQNQKDDPGYQNMTFEERLTLMVDREYDARIKTELNHLGIIGNLQAATDEAEEWQELHDTLLSAEREYRYHGTVPDWEKISGLIKNVKENYSGTSH